MTDNPAPPYKSIAAVVRPPQRGGARWEKPFQNLFTAYQRGEAVRMTLPAGMSGTFDNAMSPFYRYVHRRGFQLRISTVDPDLRSAVGGGFWAWLEPEPSNNGSTPKPQRKPKP
jgi:hypothetical protein